MTPCMIHDVSSVFMSVFLPKGLMDTGIDFQTSVRPFPPPLGHQGPKSALSGLVIALQALSGQNLTLQASNYSRPRIRPPSFKSALCTSSVPSRFQISPPDLKHALQTSDQSSRLQISHPCLELALQASSLPSRAQVSPPRLKSAHKPSKKPSLL